MNSTTPHPTLTDLITSILIIATRMLRDLHLHASTTTILKNILAASHASARVGRAVRLATLLLRRIHIHGFAPLAPSRPRPAPPAPGTIPPLRAPRPQSTPKLHTGNADDAFLRRPIAVIVAAIARELRLAADIVGTPLPDSLQTLCFKAAMASTGLDTPEPPTPETPQTPTQATNPAAIPPNAPSPHPPETHSNPTPAPTKTLEL